MKIRNTQQIFNKNAKTAVFNCMWNIFVHTKYKKELHKKPECDKI